MKIKMTELELKNLVLRIQNMQAEFQTTEVKRAEKAAPDKLYDTLSSFSNQNDGGVIVFGLYEEQNFTVTGVNDVQALQKKVMEQYNQMEPPVRAVFTAAEIDGKYVVAAEIPPVDITERPCFYLAKGRIKGSYIRVGDADIPMTEYEVYSYEAYRKKYQDDIRPIERAEMTSLNSGKLDGYLSRLKEGKPNLSMLEDSQIMELMSIIKGGKPTLAAEMLFGLYPQAFLPQLSIIAVCVPGTEIGNTNTDGTRFVDNKRIEGTIPEMLDGAMSFVNVNTRSRTVIDKNGNRSDISDYPMKAVREIILNALVHRDYSFHTEGMPIQLTIFQDRLEVTNPGGLYGRITVDTLCKVQPDTRNPVLATALELLKITENRYSGIPTIRREMSERGLPAPVFENSRGEFKVKLYKNAAENSETGDRTTAILDFCRTPRSRQELSEFLGIASTTYAIKTYIQPLIDKGLIQLSNPSAPGSRSQKFFTAKKD